MCQTAESGRTQSPTQKPLGRYRVSNATMGAIDEMTGSADRRGNSGSVVPGGSVETRHLVEAFSVTDATSVASAVHRGST